MQRHNDNRLKESKLYHWIDHGKFFHPSSRSRHKKGDGKSVKLESEGSEMNVCVYDVGIDNSVRLEECDECGNSAKAESGNASGDTTGSASLRGGILRGLILNVGAVVSFFTVVVDVV